MDKDHFNLPPEIDGPSAWYGPAMAERSDWLTVLSDAEIAEVDDAMRRLAAEGRDIAGIRREDFPLPLLGPRLQRLVDETLKGLSLPKSS
jgi:hypothetical protein